MADGSASDEAQGTVTLRENTAESRFEILVDGQLAGISDYRLSGDRLTIVHTEVDEAYSGQGLARRLVLHVLERARQRGQAVLPSCPYARKVIAGDPDLVALVPAGQRKRFGLADD